MNKAVTQADLVTPKVTTGALPASRKVHSSPEAAPDLRVPHREIKLSDGAGEPPLPVYDTTGPYTDPDVAIDVHEGLPPVRSAWIAARNDAEPYAGRRVAEVNAETCPGARTIPRLVSTEEVVAALEAEGVVVIGQAPWRVEGEQESPWFGRARDVVVRMQPEATDIRSIDRIGLIDLGQNCDLVTALVERLSR